MTQTTHEVLGALSRSAATHRGLRLLLLFGSRARRDAREGSDWDLGYLAGPELDPSALLLDVVTALRPDRVDLHLWQAVQVVIDVAVAACLHLDLGAPASYAEAFRRLAVAGVIDDALAARLGRAAGFRTVVAHADDQLDMARVFRAAQDGPRDLETFLAALRDRLGPAAGGR